MSYESDNNTGGQTSNDRADDVKADLVSRLVKSGLSIRESETLLTKHVGHLETELKARTFKALVPRDEVTEEERKASLRDKYKDLKSKALQQASEIFPPVLIESILFQTRRMLLCGASKSRKTWLCLQIAFCLSKGLKLFGRFGTDKIPILFANLELLEATIKKRFLAIALALGYQGDPSENIRIISAAEYLDKIENDFSEFLAVQATDDQVKAVCIDPMWRLLGDRDENSNTGIGQVLKPFVRFSRESNASAVGVHHYAKGSAGLKDAIDRASGAGAWARDAATLLMLTNHREQDAYTVDVITNDFAPTDRFCIRYNHPLFELAPDLDPEDLKLQSGTKAKTTKGDEQSEKVIAVLHATDLEGGLTQAAIRKVTRIPKASLSRVLNILIAKERKVYKSRAGNEDRYALTTGFREKLDRADETEAENTA